jgi:hypothetical protein
MTSAELIHAEIVGGKVEGSLKKVLRVLQVIKNGSRLIKCVCTIIKE